MSEQGTDGDFSYGTPGERFLASGCPDLVDTVGALPAEDEPWRGRDRRASCVDSPRDESGREGDMANKPMLVESRGVTLRDFVIFQLKLALDGFKDMVVFGLSIGAIILDFIAGRGRRPRLFYSVVRISERFDAWLNLHGVARRLEENETGDGFFGASEAGSDSLIGQIEQLVRGGDEPKRRARRADDET